MYTHKRREYWTALPGLTLGRKLRREFLEPCRQPVLAIPHREQNEIAHYLIPLTQEIKAFDQMGYRYEPDLSDASHFVFVSDA